MSFNFAAAVTVILDPKKIKSVTVSSFCPSICLEVMGPDAMVLVFLMLSFKPVFSARYLLRLFCWLFIQHARVEQLVSERSPAPWLELCGFIPMGAHPGLPLEHFGVFICKWADRRLLLRGFVRTK